MPQRAHNPGHEKSEARRRKPYQAPQIVFRQTLEIVAATCNPPGGKQDPLNCPIGPIQS